MRYLGRGEGLKEEINKRKDLRKTRGDIHKLVAMQNQISNMSFRIEEKKIISTEEFKIFSEDMDYLINFFKSLAELIFLNGRMISFFSDNEHYQLNTDLIESSTQTIKSIKYCCSIGGFSDANTLIRKLRDDLIQYIYVLNIINSRNPFLNDSITLDDQAVKAWLTNSVADLEKPVKGKLEFQNYMKVLKENKSLKQVLIEYRLEKYWDTLRTRLNDYIHNNGTFYSHQNLLKANNKNLKIHLNNIEHRTSYISSFFMVTLLLIDSSMISSTDYVDYLDCDMDPPENSQYFIASFVQDFIDRKINKIHPELKQYLQNNNINSMKIE